MAQRLTDEQKLEAAKKYLDGTPAATVGAEYGTHRSSVIRWSKQIEHFQKSNAPKVSPYREFGVTGLKRWGGHIEEDYLQPWKTLETLVPLVKEMIDYPVIGSILFAVKMMMRGAEWEAVPASDSEADKKAAEFLDECMNDCSHTWDDHISQALSMIPYGFAPFEIIYKKRLGPDDKVPSNYDDGKIGWRKFALRSQDSLFLGDEWIFDDAGGIRGMNQLDTNTWQPIPIPIEKLILYRTTAEKNNPQGISALRSTYMSWFYAKNLAEIEGIAAEKLGTGVPVVYLGSDTTVSGTNSDFEFAKKVVRDSRADQQMGIVFPYPKMATSGERAGKGVLYELISPPSKGLIDFHQAIERYNQQISQTLLAQFIFFGISERGTQALAVRTTDFFTTAVEGWLQAMADTINRHAVPRLFRLNSGAFGGMTGYPEFQIGPIGDIDVKLFTEAISFAVSANVLRPHEGDERKVRQILELPDIDDPELGDELDAPLAKQTLQPQGPFGSPAAGQPVDTGKKKKETAMDEELAKLEKLAAIAERGLMELRSMPLDSKKEAMEVHSHIHMPEQSDINVNIPEQKAPQVDVHVDSPKIDVNPEFHMDAPTIHSHSHITMPEQEAPKVDVHVDIPNAPSPNIVVNVPENPVNIKLDAELHSPDEILETETNIERDSDGFIKRTLKRTFKRQK